MKVKRVTMSAKRSADQRDAERYRWLRSKAYVGGVMSAKGPEHFWTTVMCLPCQDGETFDKSIDNAMRDEPQNGSIK